MVWNRTPQKADPLAALGATVSPDLATLGGACEVIILCVNRSEDVAEVVDAILPTARPGTHIVDHSTIAPTPPLPFTDVSLNTVCDSWTPQSLAEAWAHKMEH